MQEMRRGADAVLKNRITVRHGMLRDLKAYLMQSGWILEQLVGQYEVLRARRKGYPRPLIIYDRTSGGCGYSIDERDMKVYQGWQKSRRRRGLDPNCRAVKRNLKSEAQSGEGSG